MNFISSPFAADFRRRVLRIFFAALFCSAAFFDASAQDNYVRLFDQGEDAHEKGDFQNALKFYDAALKVNPEFPEAEYQKGAALVSLGRVEDAEKSFRRAIELRADWTLPMLELSKLLVKKKNYAEAEQILARILKTDEKNSAAKLILIESYAAQTSSFVNAKNSAKAIETAEKLARLLPDSAEAKILLAQTYAQSGRTADALKILDALDQSNASVSRLKNSLLINDSQDAATLEKQLASEPTNVNILSRLCSLERVSDPQNALQYCRRAAELEPNDLNHYVAYGAALVQAKQLAAAASVLRKILQIAPDNYTAHANLATALFESKQFAEAKIEYQWLAKAKPNLAITYYLLGISHDRLQEYPKALENYRKFLSLADAKQNQLEIDKVNLRLPLVEKLAKRKKE